MNDIIINDNNLEQFGDFFFVSHGHGLKKAVSSLSDFPGAFELDLDMDLVLASENVFVDFALEQHGFIQEMAVTSPSVSVWEKTAHESILESFFSGQSGNFTIQKAHYRVDPFTQFASLTGFDYSSAILW
jgi:hypothetical protein